MECFIALYFYDSPASNPCPKQKKFNSTYSRDAKASRRLAVVELYRIRTILCSVMLCGSLWTRMAYRRNLANYDYFRRPHNPFILRENSIKIRKRIPLKGLLMSIIILLGVVLMQFEHANQLSPLAVWLGIVPVIIASFAYPLGNRKMMELCEGRLDAYQRVLGMTLASLPLWIVLSICGFLTAGLPSGGQISQSVIVAVCSGVIATVLFFSATDLARGNMQQLAVVEATQSTEVLFVVAGELMLGSSLPTMLSMIGMLVVMIGMILHSYISQVQKKKIVLSKKHNSLN
jgi:protein-S-isoprenylcysteine O-methyltransferase Ste14